MIIGANVGSMIGIYYAAFIARNYDMLFYFAAIFISINSISLLMAAILNAYRPSKDFMIGLFLFLVLPQIFYLSN